MSGVRNAVWPKVLGVIIGALPEQPDAASTVAASIPKTVCDRRQIMWKGSRRPPRDLGTDAGIGGHVRQSALSQDKDRMRARRGAGRSEKDGATTFWSDNVTNGECRPDKAEREAK